MRKGGRKILKATGKLPVDSSSVLNLIPTVLINILSVYKLVLRTTGNSSLAQCCLLYIRGTYQSFPCTLPRRPEFGICLLFAHLPFSFHSTGNLPRPLKSVSLHGVNWHSRRVNYSLCQGNIDTAGVGVFWLLERSRSMTTQRVPLHFPTPFWKKEFTAPDGDPLTHFGYRLMARAVTGQAPCPLNSWCILVRSICQLECALMIKTGLSTTVSKLYLRKDLQFESYF